MAITQPVIFIMAANRVSQKPSWASPLFFGQGGDGDAEQQAEEDQGQHLALGGGGHGVVRDHALDDAHEVAGAAAGELGGQFGGGGACRPMRSPTGIAVDDPRLDEVDQHRPVRMASRLVVTYQPKVLLNSRPRPRLAPTPATPEMMEPASSGTMTIFRARRNRVPRKSKTA